MKLDKEKTILYLQALVDGFEKEDKIAVSMTIRDIDIIAIKSAIELLQ